MNAFANIRGQNLELSILSLIHVALTLIAAGFPRRLASD
jgi:hypothetical protein